MIRNQVNNKIYIGQTSKSLDIRFSQHLYCAAFNKQNCIKLENAIKKYGKENFSIIEIISCPTQKDADTKEQELIRFYNSMVAGYNIQPGGQGNKAANGSNNPNARLTDDEILEIKLIATKKLLTQKEIAEKFQVHRTTIQRILYNKTWISNESPIHTR